MKPLRLRMQAFGPFADSIQISFERVFSGGLFLLHGRTGAGKTTILDGICFALFGRPSTPEREKDIRALRSDAAGSETLTEIELVFAIGTNAYRVKRIPSQDALKKRGTGTTELKAAGTLEKWLGTIEDLRGGQLGSWEPLASTAREVDLSIEELLGMNEKQFRQIVILPQGRFRDFLSSSSTERQVILERLFQTDRFSRFQAWIADRSKQLETEWRAIAAETQSRLRALGLESEADLERELQSIAIQVETLGPEIRSAQERSAQFNQRVAHAEQRARLLSAKTRIAEQEALLAREIPEIDSARTQLQLQKKFAPLFAFEAESERLSDKLNQTSISLQQLLAERDEKLRHLRSAQDRYRKLETHSPSTSALETERLALADIYREFQDYRKQSERKVTLIAQLNAANSEHVQQVSIANDLKKTASDLTSRLPLLHRLCNVAEDQILTESLILLHKTEAEFHSGEAARLACTLQTGHPCPVCGSVDHPSPAERRSATTVTEPELNEVRSRHTSLTLKLQSARTTRIEQLKTFGLWSETDTVIATAGKAFDTPTQAAAKTAGVDLDFKQVSRDLERIQIEAKSVGDTIDRLLERRSVLEEQITPLDAAVTDILERIPAELRNLDAIISRGQAIAEMKRRLESETRDAQSAVTYLQTECASRSGLIEGKSDELKQLTADRDAIALKISAFDQSKRDGVKRLTPEAIEQLESRIERHDKALIGLRGEIKAIDENLNTLTEQSDLESLNRQSTEAHTRQRDLEKQFAALQERMRLLSNGQTASANASKTLDFVERKFKTAQKLHLLFSGERTVNSLSVPLARYVLQARFEACLEMANRRLIAMSRGQYQLRRPALSRNLTHSQGLNLSVEDAHTGRERPADSLSGGESFMAALALALGLSDVVQADLGGVRLDSLFIDEGFGTLDSESLDLAVRTLLDLQAGGRMVGIISHVQELQTQIKHRLEVKKSRSITSASWAPESSPHASN